MSWISFNELFCFQKPLSREFRTAPNQPVVREAVFKDDDGYSFQYSGPLQEDTEAVVQRNWQAIRTYALRRKHTRVYNIKIENNDLNEAVSGENAMNIFYEQSNKFRVNVSVGCILVQNSTGSLRYVHPSANQDRIFTNPKLIQTASDYSEFLQSILDEDIIENSLRARPDTLCKSSKV